MEKKKAYYEEGWTPESDFYEGYRLLKGPENFECCLTEPEDRCWSRDLAPVVDRLNQQHARIAELEAWQREALPLLEIVEENFDNGYDDEKATRLINQAKG